MTQYLAPFFAIWTLLVIAFWIEHLLWSSLSFLWRYVIGLATFCGGLALFGLLIDDPLLVTVPGFLASAGLVVVLLYRNEDALAERERAGRRAGEVIGMTRGLTKELKNGDASATGKPTTDSPIRKN